MERLMERAAGQGRENSGRVARIGVALVLGGLPCDLAVRLQWLVAPAFAAWTYPQAPLVKEVKEVKAKNTSDFFFDSMTCRDGAECYPGFAECYPGKA